MPPSKEKNLLVTGGAGFIGSNFVRQMIDLGHRVVVLDSLTYAGHEENLSGIKRTGTFSLIVGNICDARLVSDILNQNAIDSVVNFAAESHVDRSINAPAEFIDTNIRGTFTMLTTSLDYWRKLDGEKKEKFRYVQISTDEVYGSLGPMGKFSERTAFAPNSPYSASKAAGDHLVRAWYHTYGLPTITTHCSNNYGPYQYPEKLIPHMITCALHGKPLPVYGDGGNIRDWIHVEDHCNGVRLALEAGKPGESYCFGGNAEHNNLDVVRTICRTLDRLRPQKNGKSYEQLISFVADRLGHDQRYAIDDTHAQNELSFSRRFNFEKGLADTVQWYLDNQAWCEAVTRKNLDINNLK